MLQIETLPPGPIPRFAGAPSMSHVKAELYTEPMRTMGTSPSAAAPGKTSPAWLIALLIGGWGVGMFFLVTRKSKSQRRRGRR